MLARAGRRLAMQRGTAATATVQAGSVPQSPLVKAVSHAKSGAAVQQCAWFSQQRKSARPSFAIAEAFEGHDDEDNDDEDDSSLQADGQWGGAKTQSASAAVAKQIRAAMEKKKAWMQSLAADGHFAQLVQVVADCYAPLYASHQSLTGKKCALQALFPSESPVAMKYQPKRFDDTVTKMTEQEALALLMIAKQPSLAIAIYEHREALAEYIGDEPVIIAGNDVMDDVVVDLAKQFRTTYSWAMGAYNAVGDHEKMMAVYDEAIAAEIYPTANMNTTYVSHLIDRRKFDEVNHFYRDVVQGNRPTNVYFYRQMLFVCLVTHDSVLLGQVLQDMKVKGFKLRATDYLRAIRTFDDQYYLVPRVVTANSKNNGHRNRRDKHSNNKEQLMTPMDNYVTCVKRNDEQELDPEKYHELDAASQAVLVLFDEMVEDERIMPEQEEFFPRAITAAVYLQHYEKVEEILVLHEAHAKTPLHYTGVRMAVNAFLLMDKPARALELVQSVYPRITQGQEFAHLANILEYLCVHRNAQEILAVLDKIVELDAASFFSNTVAEMVIMALCHKDSNLQDSNLWEVLVKHEALFMACSKPFMFKLLLDSSCYHGRLDVVKSAVRARDVRSVPNVKAKTGRMLMDAFMDAGDAAFVAELFPAIDLKVAKPEHVAAICFAMIRACEQLGQPAQGQRVYNKHLKKLLSVQELPADIQTAIAVTAK